MLDMIVKKYDPVYILRVSDDMAIAPHRLSAALAQWAAMGTDYIGCMVCSAPRGCNYRCIAWHMMNTRPEVLNGGTTN